MTVDELMAQLRRFKALGERAGSCRVSFSEGLMTVHVDEKMELTVSEKSGN